MSCFRQLRTTTAVEPTETVTVVSNMNKHTLEYHTRLHEWYRQHNVLQDKRHANINKHLSAQKMEGIENLSSDKLQFIIEWCLDVNSTFFNVRNKETKVGFNGQSSSLSYAGISNSTSPQAVYSSEVFTPVNQRNKPLKSFIKHRRFQASGIIRSRSVTSGGQKKGHVLETKKLVSVNKNVPRLDLCVRNSKADVTTSKDFSCVTRNSSNHREKYLTLKENENRFSGEVTRCNKNLSTVRRNELKRNYRITSAINSVKTDMRRHDNRSCVIKNVTNEKYRQTTQNQTETELSKSGDGYLSGELQNTNKSNVKGSMNVTSNQYEFEKVKTSQLTIEDSIHKVDLAIISTFSSTCQSVCSNDTESLPTIIPCIACIDPTNIENGENIDKTTKLSAITEYIEKKTSELLKSKENNQDEKTAIASIEPEQVKTIVGTDTVSNNMDSYMARQTQEMKSVSITSSCHSNLDNYIDNVSNSDSFGNRQMLIPNSKIGNKGDQTKTGDDIKSKSMIVRKPKEGHPENDKQRNKSRCVTVESMSCSSKQTVASQRGCGRRLSVDALMAPAISNISLSNNLLNVLSIDDCKLSMRYNLPKINVRVNPEGQGERPLQLGFINSRKIPIKINGKIQSRVTTGTIRETTSISAFVLRRVSLKLTDSKIQNKTLVKSENVHVDRKKRPISSISTGKTLRNLINRQSMKPQNSFVKSRKSQSVLDASQDRQGPVYRRLHAALRVHMEDVLQAHCAKLLARHKI